MTERSRRVVLLIDYDNLQICAARDTPGRDLQLPPVVQLAQRYGTVILSRAYAEWNLSTERLAVYKAGIEPAFAPVLRTESDRSGKSLADTVMVAEGMDMLWTLSPEVVVLATSDKDLIPLVRVAKQRGAFVVVLGSDFTAIPLREMADEHVTYRQLISDAGVRYATEAGPGRQPAALPEPSRRRRERRERGSTPAPAATPQGTPPRPEPSPAASPAPAPAAEAVAPITSTPGEADAQTSGRRRRRRGSRRRSDRLGLNADGSAIESGDGDDHEEPDETDSLTATPEGDLAGDVEGDQAAQVEADLTAQPAQADLTARPEGGLTAPPAQEDLMARPEGGLTAPRVEGQPTSASSAGEAEATTVEAEDTEAVAQAVEIEGAPVEVAP
ncbi:MAG: NYN domain-containing protein, partial [Chloroflexi bacterium]|nr:NYN domain-containing protein [Chloroflexota bacterium]